MKYEVDKSVHQNHSLLVLIIAARSESCGQQCQATLQQQGKMKINKRHNIQSHMSI